MSWFKRDKSADEKLPKLENGERRCAPKACGRSAKAAGRSSGRRIWKPTGTSARSAARTPAWTPSRGSNCCSTMAITNSSIPDLTSSDPLEFRRSASPTASGSAAMQEATTLSDALISARRQLWTAAAYRSAPWRSEFIGGSMGCVVGEKITRAIERAIVERDAADRSSPLPAARACRKARSA